MRRASIIATTLITAALVAGCGGSSPGIASLTAESSSAHRLLLETFEGARTIKSGVVSLALKVVPSGSATITQPIEFSVGGPFTSSGAGKLPQSDFTIAFSAQGHTGDLQVISTGGKGYVTLSGQSYQLPAASYSQLKSGLGSLAGATGRSTKPGSDTLGALGIHPVDWVKDPKIAGNASVDGAATTHISARVDTAALLRDLSRLAGRASSVTGAAATGALRQGISAAEQRSIAKALRSPRVDIWTGTNDRILRRLTFSATIPVSGAASTELGGMTSAVVSFDLEYSHLNRAQTITAPSSVQPYSTFRAEVATFLQEIEGGLTGTTGTTTSATGTTTSATGTTTSTTGNGFTGTIQSGTSTVANANPSYTNCISAAKGDVSKMQRCAKLLTTP